MFYIWLLDGRKIGTPGAEEYKEEGPLIGPIYLVDQCNRSRRDYKTVRWLQFASGDAYDPNRSSYLHEHHEYGIYYDGFHYACHRILAGPINEGSEVLQYAVKFDGLKAQPPKE